LWLHAERILKEIGYYRAKLFARGIPRELLRKKDIFPAKAAITPNMQEVEAPRSLAFYRVGSESANRAFSKTKSTFPSAGLKKQMPSTAIQYTAVFLKRL